jgi:TonB family protein
MGIAGTIVVICFLLVRGNVSLQNKLLLLPPDQTTVHTTPVDLEKPKTESTSTPEAPKHNTNVNSTAILIRDSLVFSNDTMRLEPQLKSNGTDTSAFIVKKENTGEGGGKPGGTGSKSDTVVALIADEYPEFEGGLVALNRWIVSHIRYPLEAIDRYKQGKVHVKFIVDETGKVILPTAMNKLGYGLEEEALRVVAGIPDFKSPAKLEGKAVKCYFVVPIHFKLY